MFELIIYSTLGSIGLCFIGSLFLIVRGILYGTN